MTVLEKVAYLKGLVSGLKMDDDSSEGKVLVSVLDVLEDLAKSVTDLEDAVEELGEVVDCIDEDLEDVENVVYDDDYDCDFDCDDCDGCDNYDEYDDYDEFDDIDEPLYEVECPTCGDTICLDESMIAEGEIECPNCGEKLEFDLDELDCTGDCSGCSGCDLD